MEQFRQSVSAFRIKAQTDWKPARKFKKSNIILRKDYRKFREANDGHWQMKYAVNYSLKL